MPPFIKQNGNYQNLLCYQISVKITIITEIFVQRFIRRGSRTADQMEQAARSCKQNIVEGSEAAATSKETEIKLTNVARASLSELEEDYWDYLRFNNLTLWGKDHPRTEKLRSWIKTDDFNRTFQERCLTLPPEEFCNLAITLIKQTKYLLDRLIRAQQERFLAAGGIREAMSRARRDHRSNQNN